MGLFDWFRRPQSNVEILNDKIWLTHAAKLAGIEHAVVERLGSPHPPLAVILIAHFDDYLSELAAIAERNGARGAVTATTAGDLLNARALPSSLDETHRIDLVIGERHPLHSQDEAILEFAKAVPCRWSIEHHMSLEDAVLKSFAGDSIRNVLAKLGMAENEAIESLMVSRRIVAAQRDREKRVTSNHPAKSAAEWIDRNEGRL